MIKNILAVAVASAISLGAQAATVSLTDQDPGQNASFSYTGTLSGGSFSDTLNFTLPAPTSWEASGNASASYYGLNFFGLLLGQGVTSLSVTIFGQTYSGSLGGFGFPAGTLTVSVPDQVVPAGNYSALIQGTSQDPRLIPGHPSYTFSLVAMPVPEPESYAMFLAGLGLMGAIAIRRKKNKA